MALLDTPCEGQPQIADIGGVDAPMIVNDLMRLSELTHARC
jgi:hypothetical protein